MFSQFGYSFFFPSSSISITGLTAPVLVFLTSLLIGTSHQFGLVFKIMALPKGFFFFNSVFGMRRLGLGNEYLSLKVVYQNKNKNKKISGSHNFFFFFTKYFVIIKINNWVHIKINDNLTSDNSNGWCIPSNYYKEESYRSGNSKMLVKDFKSKISRILWGFKNY